MRYLLGFCLVIGGICGLAISQLGETVVSSSMAFLNGIDLSLYITIFSVIVFVGGLRTLLVSD